MHPVVLAVAAGAIAYGLSSMFKSEEQDDAGHSNESRNRGRSNPGSQSRAGGSVADRSRRVSQPTKPLRRRIIEEYTDDDQSSRDADASSGSTGNHRGGQPDSATSHRDSQSVGDDDHASDDSPGNDDGSHNDGNDVDPQYTSSNESDDS